VVTVMIPPDYVRAVAQAAGPTLADRPILLKHAKGQIGCNQIRPAGVVWSIDQTDEVITGVQRSR